jgi:hypothetical protein
VRLADLRPAWTDRPHDNRSGLAVVLDCPGPCCQQKPEVERYRIQVIFLNPIDGGKPMGSAASCRWTRTGETFETLTLRPSVDAREIHHAHFTLTDGTLYVE